MSAAVTELRPGQRVGDAQAPSAGAEEDSLTRLIRLHLEESDETDPSVLADQIITGLSEEAKMRVLREGMRRLVQTAIRNTRRRPETPVAPFSSGKWDNVRAAVQAAPDIFHRRYKTEAGWKFLGDFTKADAVWNEAEHRKLAEASSIRARQFAALASRLTGRVTVRDSLTPSVVEEIFNA